MERNWLEFGEASQKGDFCLGVSVAENFYRVKIGESVCIDQEIDGNRDMNLVLLLGDETLGSVVMRYQEVFGGSLEQQTVRLVKFEIEKEFLEAVGGNMEAEDGEISVKLISWMKQRELGIGREEEEKKFLSSDEGDQEKKEDEQRKESRQKEENQIGSDINNQTQELHSIQGQVQNREQLKQDQKLTDIEDLSVNKVVSDQKLDQKVEEPFTNIEEEKISQEKVPKIQQEFSQKDPISQSDTIDFQQSIQPKIHQEKKIQTQPQSIQKLPTPQQKATYQQNPQETQKQEDQFDSPKKKQKMQGLDQIYDQEVLPKVTSFSFQSRTPRPSILQIQKRIQNLQCSYIQRMKKCQYFDTSTKIIIQHLQSSLGSAFYSLQEEAVKYRPQNPSNQKPASPTSRLTSSNRKKSPISKKRSLLEVKFPSTLKLAFQNLSGDTQQSLYHLTMAALAKRDYSMLIKQKNEKIEQVLEKQSTQAQNLEKSYAETEEEVSDQIQSLEKVIFHQDNRDKLKSLVQESSEKMKALTLQVQRLKKEVIEQIQEEKLNFDQKEVILLAQSLEQTETSLLTTKQNLEAQKEKTQKFIHEKSVQSFSIAQQISFLRSLINSSEQEISKLNSDNLQIRQQILRTQSAITQQQNLSTRIQIHNKAASSESSLTDSLIQQSSQLKSNKQLIDFDTFGDLNTLQQEINFLNSSTQISALSLQENNILIQELRFDLQPTYQTQIEDQHPKFTYLQTKKQKAHTSKSNLLNQLDYLSDISFAIIQANLKENRITKQLQQVNKNRFNQISQLNQLLNDYKKMNPVHIPDPSDSLDVALSDYLNARDAPLLLPFKRISRGLYWFGTRQILVLLVRNKISIKVGGGFLNVDDFLASYQQTEFEKIKFRDPVFSEQSKKFHSKWADSVVGGSPSPSRQVLVNAARSRRLTPVIGVKRRTFSASFI